MKSLKSIPAQPPMGVAPVAPYPVAPYPVAPYPGQLIGERYRLEEWLESGAMGSVWRAEQVRLRSPAAVKFLDPSLVEFPEMHDRFLQEARSAAAVQSAHVIQIFDYGSEGGIPYIAMELLRGENLDARLARRGLLTPRELNKIFSEVALGLGEAHALGVIHRDVKPGNIFIERQGKHEVTKLIDFGIAKIQQSALGVSQIIGTVQGTVLGTPQYMSPEQLRGRSSVDHRTDLWALGIIACECLTGRHPFPGTTIGDVSVQICVEQPPAPSTLGRVPDGFDAWFFKAVSKDPVDRFESAAAMSDALTKILLPRREREPVSLRARPSVALRNLKHLGRASMAASHRAVSLLRPVLIGALARGGALAHDLRRQSLRVADVVGKLHARHLSGRVSPGSAALIGSTLILASLLLWWSHRPSLRAVEAEPAPARLAASAREVQSRPKPGIEERELPVLQADDLRPVVETEDQEAPGPSVAPSPAVSSVVASSAAPSSAVRSPTARRRGKKSPPAHAGASGSSLSSPMSIAMGQLGARLAQGGEPRRQDPKPASPEAHKRTEP
jgi:serine/threonine protein kinase